MKTLANSIFACASYYVTVDCNSATAFQRDWIHIL